MIDVYQFLLFSQNFYTNMLQESREEAKMQVYVNFIVILGYSFLTLLLKHTGTKSDMITIVVILIFALQQMHLFVKVDPSDSASMQSVFRMESLFQLVTFITMIGPFLPLRFYLPPIALLYTGSFWATYY